jgi:maltose O-acetyltransferase
MCTLVRMTSTPAAAGSRSMRERMLAGDPEPAGADTAATDLVAAHDTTTARRRPRRRQLLERLLGAIGDPARVVRTLESP